MSALFCHIDSERRQQPFWTSRAGQAAVVTRRLLSGGGFGCVRVLPLWQSCWCKGLSLCWSIGPANRPLCRLLVSVLNRSAQPHFQKRKQDYHSCDIEHSICCEQRNQTIASIDMSIDR